METKEINYCDWCGNKTDMEAIQLPDSPILEFLEEKINKLGRDKVWGENSNWAYTELDPNIEAELLVYDELLNKISLKRVCEECIEEDNKLYDKYYEDSQ